ncbi:cobalamin B12-binding domain-containing protein [Leptolyngbya sp. 15MV]|nr:cobalamin B12-binding domain-containing protein [Leptolyngbya sp. 15MV]
MSTDILQERFFEILIAGNRPEARVLVQQQLDRGASAKQLITDLFWPTYETLERLHRADQLSKLSHHLATRLLRVLVDQNAARLAAEPSRGRRILALCGPADADELGAQMAVDLLEQAGYTVSFGGGGIANDEILQRVHEDQPHVLLMFASAPSDLPCIRELIDHIREINAAPDLQIVVGGGVFNRAEGLAEEIGADVWARHPLELVDAITNQPYRRAELEQRTVGRKRKLKAA